MTTIIPSEVEHNRLAAVFLKPHLKLLSVGMKNSQFSARQLLDKATAITGKKYKRGQYDLAVQDLQSVIDKTA